MAILAVCLVIGVVVDRRIGPAALSLSLFTHAQCANQKCVVAIGPGQNQCATNDNCLPANDPQHWCDIHNVETGLKVSAERYPNGNFSCDCYYLNRDNTHSQTPCINSHLQ